METQQFGARLRELRRQSGLTLRELADKTGVDFTYLSKIESGVMPPPSEQVILKIAEVLNADKDELMVLAGRIPSDIAEMLKNRETLQLIRAESAKKKAQAIKKKERASIMKSSLNLKKLYRVALAAVLVLAIGASLWFAAPLPIKALNIEFTQLPTSGTLGSTYEFDVTVTVQDMDVLPIQSIDLEIYNVASPTTYKVSCTTLPMPSVGLTTDTKSYTSTQTGGGAVTISATSTYGWLFVSSYTGRAGYGYRDPEGWGYHTSMSGYGYGYGYSGYQGETSITYNVRWSVPSNWPTGAYKVKTVVWGNSSNKWSGTSDSFTLSAPAVAVGVAPVVPAPGITSLSGKINTSGVFTADVTAQSADGKVSLSVKTGTQGLTREGTPLSEIRILEKADPPPPPEDTNAIGLVYDLGPDGATFDQPVSVTLTYDELQIPAGVAEENLYIAMWDEEAGEWVRLASVVDTTNNTITVELSHFTLLAIIAPTQPAAFRASDLTITPAEVDIGEKVTISVRIYNTGDLGGSYEVTFKINNVVKWVEEITLAGHASQEVTITTTGDTAGTYNVTVNGLAGTFVVRAAPAPPAPAPPAPPAPAPPAPPAPAPPAPVVPPVTPINWWLIGGIIAAVIIIGLIAWQVVARRRA